MLYVRQVEDVEFVCLGTATSQRISPQFRLPFLSLPWRRPRRRRRPARKRPQYTELVLSAISVVEWEHGIARAQSPEQTAKRRWYWATFFATIPAVPFTRDIGHLVSHVDAESRKQGLAISFAGLFIGGTALHRGFGLLTDKERHLRMLTNRPVDSL